MSRPERVAPLRSDACAETKAMPANEIPPTPLYKGGHQMGLSYMQQVMFPLWQRGIEGDFAARSSSRKSSQHIYSTSKVKLYHPDIEMGFQSTKLISLLAICIRRCYTAEQ
jgi:hypothetical protein